MESADRDETSEMLTARRVADRASRGWRGIGRRAGACPAQWRASARASDLWDSDPQVRIRPRL